VRDQLALVTEAGQADRLRAPCRPPGSHLFGEILSVLASSSPFRHASSSARGLAFPRQWALSTG